MRNVKLTLAYDGTDYAGWQVQPDQKTVQGILENALRKITAQEVSTVASGRTDAGVHALGQVVSLRTNTHLSIEELQRALNAVLPRDISVLEANEVSNEFHAIRSAVRKRYRYQIYDGSVRPVFLRRYCWEYRSRLDHLAMNRAAQELLGTHDFSSFETTGSPRKNSIRTIYDIGVERTEQGRGDQIVLEVEANGFLYNMVRAIVGTLVEVGRNAKPEAWVTEVLQAIDRSKAGPTAPPQGLFLVQVSYLCDGQ